MENNHANKRIYEFEEFCLDANGQELRRGRERITLTPKAIELLTVLIERRGQIVSREEILNNLWRDTFVDESNLTVTVSMLRRAFGEKANDKHFIETLPKRGYRFNAEVRTPDELVVERQTLTRIKIENTERETNDSHGVSTSEAAALKQYLRKFLLATAAFACLIVAVLAGGTYFWRSGNETRNFLAARAQTRGTIAVLPFAFDDKKLGAAGAAGDLTTAVAAKLSANSAAFLPLDALRTAGADKTNFLLAGRKLGASAVLLGNLYEHPSDIHLRVHLVSVGDGTLLWAKTYLAPPSEKENLLADIAQNVSDNLLKIGDADLYERQARRFTTSEDAYWLYLQGRLMWNGRGDNFGDRTASIKYYEDALRLDSNFVLPMIGLADWEKTESYNSVERKKAEENLRRALQLAPDSADAHAALGFVQMIHDWNWQSAETEFQTALRIDSNCVNALRWYALLLALETRYSEATEKINLARALAPYQASIKQDEAEIRFLQRNYSRAIYAARELQEEIPHSDDKILGDAYFLNGDYAEAVKVYSARLGTFIEPEKLRRSLPEPDTKRAVARLLVERCDREKKYDFRSSYWKAEWLAVAGEKEEALDLLEQAATEHHFFIVWIKASPFFENLRNEPRYQNLVKRVGLEN